LSKFITNLIICFKADSTPTLNHVIPALAQIEKTLNEFKQSTTSSSELIAVASLALKAFEFKLKKLREIDEYAVAVVLDPVYNKLLPKICESTGWNFDKVCENYALNFKVLLQFVPHIFENSTKH
jgi:hypothetical protein